MKKTKKITYKGKSFFVLKILCSGFGHNLKVLRQQINYHMKNMEIAYESKKIFLYQKMMLNLMKIFMTWEYL